MNFLSIFVLIPLLMLPALWIARSLNQVRGVMVAGSTALLALSVYLVFAFLDARALDPHSEMLFVSSVEWFPPLHINYTVGVDGISVAMLLLSAIIVFTGTFASLVYPPFHGCVWVLHHYRHVRHVHVL